MHDKLLPCPFCSFEPDINDPDCIYPVRSDIPYLDENEKIIYTIWNINCYESGGGCSCSILGDSRQDCIDKWNKRA